jgi:hypothetical protein
MEFTEQYKDKCSIIDHSDKGCCVCFQNNPIILFNNNEASLVELLPDMFVNNVIPDEILFKSACNIHYLCISCIRRIIHNYENHPINHNSSHFACPYPFQDCLTPIGFPHVFDHSLIKKICRTDAEWTNYISYSSQYAFPGYYIFKCPMQYTYRNPDQSVASLICNADILIENESLKNIGPGELIIECSQNHHCLKRFCFHCYKMISTYDGNLCYDCKYCFENENPNVLNYYFNKHSDTNSDLLNFEEHEYLYFNREITLEIAVSQISNLIHNVNSFMICPICKISIHKTEKCNGVSHHGLERCYACGRIGFKVKGLGQHWNSSGIGGCFRFDHEDYVKKEVPFFVCTEYSCFNHDKGDCQVSEHRNGIHALSKLRKKSYVYHLFKSLNPTLRYTVFDTLFSQYNAIPTFIEYLPYKQSLVLLESQKHCMRHFSEEVLYEQLDCSHPNDNVFFSNKSIICPPDHYLVMYSYNKDLIPVNTTQPQITYSPYSSLHDILRYYGTPDPPPDTTPLLLENTQNIDNLNSIENTVDMLMSSILNEINDTNNNEHNSVDITDSGYTLIFDGSDSEENN